MQIRLKIVLGNEILSGAITGRNALGKLLDIIDKKIGEPEIVFIDFGGIEVATASFLRECVLEFRNTVRRRWPQYYPVIANANDVIIEELSILLESQRDVLMICTLDKNGKVTSSYIIGSLDPKQKVTYELVNKRGETDASELMRNSADSDLVGQTAWNNRLASLTKLGLLVELSQGRAKRYRPLFLGG